MDKDSIIPYKFNIYFITCFENKDEKFIFHPFKKTELLLSNINNNNINVIVDNDDSINTIKASLYKYLMNYFIVRNRNDIYWYRMLFAVIIGLFIYIAASIGIPDPIPIFDELAISIIAGILSFYIFRVMKLFNISGKFNIDKY